MSRELNKRELIIIAFILAMFLIILAWAGRVGQNYQPEPMVTFNLPEEDVSFICEIADTPAERAIGLMDRENLDSDEGMLFIFETVHNVSFWMKNTSIPLDIVFIDESGRVVNIEEANPEPGVNDAALARYSSDRPVKWVLEINQGLCAIHGITPGTIVLINLQ